MTRIKFVQTGVEVLALMWVELHQKEEVKTTAMAVLPIWQNPTIPGQHGMNRRGNNPKTKPASMAIESTLNQQRKCLRCHMKPASFFLHVSFHRQSDFIYWGIIVALKILISLKEYILFSKKIVIFAGKNIKI